MKKKTIKWEKFCKLASVDPKKYDTDIKELAHKLRVCMLLYGDLGMKGLWMFIEQVYL